MPRINAGLACPICDQHHQTSTLFQEVPGMRIVCENQPTHFWTDLVVLANLQPRKLAVVQKKVDSVQGDHVAVTLKVPRSTEAALVAKYGDKLPNSLTSVLQACAEPEMMLLSSSDLQRITERTGMKCKSSAELFGLIFQLGEEVKAERNEKERALRSASIKRGDVNEGVIIDLGEFLSKAVAKAEDSGLELGQFLSKYMQDSLENDWITAS